MNHVVMIGNLTRDPVVRATQAGVTVCRFAIAVNRRQRNPQGGGQDVDYFNVTAWRQLGDLCGQYLAKGRKVAVTGSLQVRDYADRDGVMRRAVEIIADGVEFLTPRDAQGAAADAQPTTAGAPGDSAQADGREAFIQVDDDDLPF